MKIQKFNNSIRFFSFLFIAFLASNGIAQQTVSANDILSDIKNGKDISYENVTITGTLDMTYMDDKLPELPKRKRWWKNGGDNTVKETIESKISFVNCTFTHDVFAYIHEEDSGYTFIANFENDVRFKNCEFKRKALFKYSKFERNADFSSSRFGEQSTFKYAKFDTKVNFENVVFEEDAIFKYTKFNEGVAFNNAKFKENLNLKYTKVRGDFEIDKISVNGDINSKYTNINGNSFSKHLVSND